MTHEFLYIPECPVPLFGRDLLSHLESQVTFSPDERPTLHMGPATYLLSLSVTPQDEWGRDEWPGGNTGSTTAGGLGRRKPPWARQTSRSNNNRT